MYVQMSAAMFSSLIYLAITWLKPSLVQAFSHMALHAHRSFPDHVYDKKQVAECRNASRFRRIDGQCNNLEHPIWGSAFVPLVRLLPSAYEDGIGKPRTTGANNLTLPTARDVSVKCHTPKSVKTGITLMVMQFGQFLDHDIILTPQKPDHATGNCTCESKSYECFPMPLSPQDEFFTNRDCLPFTRSNNILATDDHHSKPVRQQFNAITAYIDASSVYGSSEAELKSLRAFSEFELRVLTVGSKGDFLPPEPCEETCQPGRGEYCFLAGDERINALPSLVVIHTVFVREHNRIARILNESTNWSNERIFQETRKIIGASMQHITYNEFLPVVLGSKAIEKYGLDMNSYSYDQSLRADISNSFATAAFRFGHSLIPDYIELSSGNLALKDLLLSPSTVFSSFKEMSNATARQRTKGVDRHFSYSVTRHLFESAPGNGLDLAALNIQRGRDHGLPSLNEYRKLCNLPAFESLEQLFPNDPVAASAYSHIEEVDLYTGGLAEQPVEGDLVGPTFACLLGTGFQKLKYGDRFFYLTKDSVVGFQEEQLKEILKVRLSKILCDHTGIEFIQENVFLEVSCENPLKKCKDLPGIDLSQWTN